MKLDKYGRELPVMEKPGEALPPFKKKMEAVDYALQHPEQFPSGRYLAKSIEVLSAPEEPAAPATTNAGTA